jgi:cold shock CspA family protein
VNVYALLARMWLERGDFLPAAQAAALERLVREREGWSLPARLQQLEEKIQKEAAEANVSLEDVPNDYRRLEHLQRETWQQGVEAGVELCYGVITRLPPEKDFGFLRREDGGGDVYFKRREVPRACLREGQRIAFVLEPSFDAKKQQETVRAVKIRPA